MRIEDRNISTETVPLADLAAEAGNDASPAQSVPETLPPQARRKKKGERDEKKPRPETGGACD